MIIAQAYSWYIARSGARLVAVFGYSNLYALPTQLILVYHIALNFFEPETLSKLKSEGLPTNLIIANAVCIALEFVFRMVLNSIHRYGIFSLKHELLVKIYELYYGVGHPWTRVLRENENVPFLVCLGPHCLRYILRGVFWVLVVVDFVMRVVWRNGLLLYRVPPLPFLFIVENRHVWAFLWEFVAAVRFASDAEVWLFPELLGPTWNQPGRGWASAQKYKAAVLACLPQNIRCEADLIVDGSRALSCTC